MKEEAGKKKPRKRTVSETSKFDKDTLTRSFDEKLKKSKSLSTFSSFSISPKTTKASFNENNKQAVLNFLQKKDEDEDEDDEDTVNHTVAYKSGYTLKDNIDIIIVTDTTGDKKTLFTIEPQKISASSAADLTVEQIQDMLQAALLLFPDQQLSITVPAKDQENYKKALEKLPPENKKKFEQSSSPKSTEPRSKTPPPPPPLPPSKNNRSSR